MKNKEKQAEKHTNATKSSDFSNELKRIEGIFPQNLINDLVRAKLKKSLNCKILLKKMIKVINSNAEKHIVLVNIHCLLLL